LVVAENVDFDDGDDVVKLNYYCLYDVVAVGLKYGVNGEYDDDGDDDYGAAVVAVLTVYL